MKREIIRKLEKPYFLLRTHDRLGHFMQHQMNRMFFLGKHGLGTFMPPAKLIELDGVKAVRYSLTKAQAKTLRPLKHITMPELKNFQKAAIDFIQTKENLTKYEKNLRQSFRFPDPELEPDAYFLWGTKRNPKLLVLWGIEKIPGSSLPLVNIRRGEKKEIHDSVFSKLAYKVIRRTKEWVFSSIICALFATMGLLFSLVEDTSPPGIESVSAVNEPFLITVTFNEEIDFKSVGKDTFKLRNTAYVLEPIPIATNPKALHLMLDHPLKDDRDYYLDFGLEHRPHDLSGNQIGEEEISNSERVRHFRFEDLQAPIIREIEPLPPSSLIVRVNEGVSLRSVLRPSTFRISDYRLVDARLNEKKEAKEIILEFDQPLINNGYYVLEINGLEDDSEFRNQVNKKFEFRYLDTFGPDLVKTIEGNNQSEIILVFDECLDPETSLKPSNYKINGLAKVRHVVPYKPYQDAQWGEDSFSAVRLVTTPLIPRREYEVEVVSIADRMKTANLSQILKTFYIFSGTPDRTPPFIRKAKGIGDQLIIEFSEILDHEKIAVADLKVVDLRTNRKIGFGSLSSEVLKDFSRLRLKLKSHQYPGRMYGVYFNNCNDSSGNTTHLEHTYKAKGLFREPIPLQTQGSILAGESVVHFSLPHGVRWGSGSTSKIEAYGISIHESETLEVENLVYELTNQGPSIKLNLKNPVVFGSYEFFLEGVVLADGSLVDRPYHGRVNVGS
mgnify:CR=1 FL=1